jgi:hypothetical protein
MFLLFTPNFNKLFVVEYEQLRDLWAW